MCHQSMKNAVCDYLLLTVPHSTGKIRNFPDFFKAYFYMIYFLLFDRPAGKKEGKKEGVEMTDSDAVKEVRSEPKASAPRT